MTIPHQSYYELKKDTSEDFARMTLLYTGLSQKFRCIFYEI